MPEFTEAETEYWLEPETRKLMMTDGSMRAFTGTRTLWDSYDFLLRQASISSIRMVQLALKDSKARKLPFELTFPGIVAEQYGFAMERGEARIKEIDEALLKARIAFTRAFRNAAATA